MEEPKQQSKPEQKPEQTQITFVWIALGIAAIVVMWLLSSWLF